ncbi:hypothetical protein BO70DRAFT_34216 [Aspergillus heteromorphus CBS 117.55]|uniref:Uncharacterized protein n=1 Tax=Aspergillus heteromorphus CBS 117.55 TaxID=1448321 RepID=A0A317WB54_9EURO|nr:uncharacterized protein BO70DRAFT_34216 [Aspergillus heteromorphus CBS 117.55]PWY83031.1 hypothetical protein BO70DRAFT_34216 [Aspergillus heteromorphus CBS 117.55]
MQGPAVVHQRCIHYCTGSPPSLYLLRTRSHVSRSLDSLETLSLSLPSTIPIDPHEASVPIVTSPTGGVRYLEGGRQEPAIEIHSDEVAEGGRGGEVGFQKVSLAVERGNSVFLSAAQSNDKGQLGDLEGSSQLVRRKVASSSRVGGVCQAGWD